MENESEKRSAGNPDMQPSDLARFIAAALADRGFPAFVTESPRETANSARGTEPA
jgi:hypothetical protein